MSDSREAEMVRRRVIYTGRVQGVGFRYTTHSIARRYSVSGYVRNCSDGTVELEAQGTESAVNEFLAEVSRRFEGYITDRETADVSPDDDDADDFSIRY